MAILPSDLPPTPPPQENVDPNERIRRTTESFGPLAEIVGNEASPINRNVAISHGGRIGGEKSPYLPSEQFVSGGSPYGQSAHGTRRAKPVRVVNWTRPVRRMRPERAEYGPAYRTGSLAADIRLLAGASLRRGRPRGAGIKGLIGGAPSRPRRMRPIRKTAGRGGKRKAARVAGIAGGLAHNSTRSEAGW